MSQNIEFAPSQRLETVGQAEGSSLVLGPETSDFECLVDGHGEDEIS